MALKSTELVKQYAINPELLANKHPNVADLIEELQAKVTALAALANETKAVVNAGAGTVEAEDVTI